MVKYKLFQIFHLGELVSDMFKSCKFAVLQIDKLHILEMLIVQIYCFVDIHLIRAKNQFFQISKGSNDIHKLFPVNFSFD